MSSLKARKLRVIAKKILKQTPLPPKPPAGPVMPFRPITPNPLAVVIPPIRRDRNRRRRAEPMTKFLFCLPVREAEELRRIAEELMVSRSTIIRLAYKRFMRMPEPPLTKSQMRLWRLGVQMDRKAMQRKERIQLQRDLMLELDAQRRLTTKHLEHKLTEAVSTNDYHKTKKMVFRTTGHTRPPGNPEGKNGHPDPHPDAGDSGVRGPVRTGEPGHPVGRADPVRVVPSAPGTTVPSAKRLMVRPREIK